MAKGVTMPENIVYRHWCDQDSFYVVGTDLPLPKGWKFWHVDDEDREFHGWNDETGSLKYIQVEPE